MSTYLVFPPDKDMYQADHIIFYTSAKGTYCYSVDTTRWRVFNNDTFVGNWVVVPASTVPAKYRTLLLLLI